MKIYLQMGASAPAVLFMACVRQQASFLLFLYLLWSRACASSNSFRRNRSRAAMQSSRASDRSEREHLDKPQKQMRKELWEHLF